MISLIDILVESKIVQVPKEILDQLPGIYEYIKTNLEDFKTKSPDSPEGQMFIPSKLQKSLKFKDLAGKDLEVSVGMYNDPKDGGAGRMDTNKDIMMVNLAFFGDKEDFLDLGEHELVHAMDPKVRDQKLFGKEYVKKGAEPTSNMDKYLKSPWEFDAFTAPLLNKLKASKEKVNDDNKFKEDMKKLFAALKTKTPDEIVDDPDLNPASWYFSSKEWTEENWPAIARDFNYELSKIKSWMTKPTLYKRFQQRRANAIGF